MIPKDLHDASQAKLLILLEDAGVSPEKVGKIQEWFSISLTAAFEAGTPKVEYAANFEECESCSA